MNIEFSCNYLSIGTDPHGQKLVHAESVHLSQPIDAKALLSQMDIKEIIEYIEGQELLVINKSAEVA